MLELACGSGEHAVVFAAALPHLVWWPTDAAAQAIASAEAWRAESGLPNLRPPVPLDVEGDWRLGECGRPPATVSAVVAVNLLHIAPITAAEGLFDGAGRHLAPDGDVLVYGPFMRDGRHTAASNDAFDGTLRAQNPAWGVRDTADLDRRARRHGLTLADAIAMPADNMILRFARTAGRR